MGLDQQARLGAWMTPQSTDAGSPSAPRPKTGHARDFSLEGNWRANLKDQAPAWSAPDWRTPNAAMADHGPMSPEFRYENGQTISLDDQASHWRTPQAGDAIRGPKSSRGAAAGYKDPAGRHSLVTEVTNWPTPDAGVFNDGQSVEAYLARKEREIAKGYNGNGGGIQLGMAVQLWPTPMSRDHRSGATVKSDEELWGKKGRPLERVATIHSTPPVPPIPDGPTSSQLTRILLRHYRALMKPRTPDFSKLRDWRKRVRQRRLNPSFVEWLMGWPIGWTASEPVATESSLWWPRMRGELSKLGSPPAPKQGSLL